MAEEKLDKTEKVKSVDEGAKSDNSYSAIIARFSELLNNYASMGTESIYQAFARAGVGMENLAPVQNQRVKALNPLPADYTKSDLNEFLRSPQVSERVLRQITEGLKWTSYPLRKLIKSYADMLTYRYYVMPLYVEADASKSAEFMREWRLVDKLSKAFLVEKNGHKATAQALAQEKVFYILRSNVDKVHNRVNSLFFQQLPTDYCQIIGFNNITGYTISFDMMYFLQPGTDYTQYGTLFEPFIHDFSSVFETQPKKPNPTYVYASAPERSTEIKIGDNKATFYPDKVNKLGEGQPHVFMQNGRWCYYVSLPIDRVYTFEIDDSTVINASIFSGLLETFAQQADYEAAQLSLIVNPLIKIFTGEIPYRDEESASAEDKIKLSNGARAMFEAFFNNLMTATHTGGTAIYSAPFQNIKSHDFSDSANANEVSSSFLEYTTGQTGLSALIPTVSNPHAGQEEYSAKLERRFAERTYRTLENMFNRLLLSLNLKYEWEMVVFGDVYSEAQTRADAMKQIDKGDVTAWFILAALDNESVLDKVSMAHTVKASGWLELLQPPQTSYTQSGNATKAKTSEAATSEGGAPTKTEAEVAETKQEKRTEGETEN